MPHQFINPNFHPLLVHYPIALLMAGALIELFSFLGWRKSSFRAAGRWMILLGALSGVPAAMSGIYALNDVAHIGLPEADAEAPWHTVAAASPLVNDAVAWKMMIRHTLLMSIASAVVLLVVVTWIASSDGWRDRLHYPLLLLLLGGIGLTGAGAYLAGEAEFTHAVGQRKIDEAGVQPTTVQTRTLKDKIDYFVQPEQSHVIGAGAAVALALVSIGLSIRTITSAPPEPGLDSMGNVLGEHGDDPTSTPGLVALTEFQSKVPAARFWVLAFLVALLTATGGWYLLTSGSDLSPTAFKDGWQLVRDPAQNNGSALTRRLGHIICGSAIIVLPLMLAVFARWLPRSKALLSLCTLLLLCAIAGQVWLGVLLIFDGNAGPVTGYSAVLGK
jgi:uncharacterized membrane protein